MLFFTPFRRVVAGAIGAVTLVSLLAPVVHATPMPAIAFPQEHSPYKADPAEVWGRLPNGMSYVIMHHAVPPHTASIQLRIAAGSMMENAAQRGLAHFVEHMAFEGSTNQKPGELKASLERKGFIFGADANAITSDSQTVYMLNAPNTEADTLSTALSSLREIAGNLTFDAGALDRERGVVLSEERARDSGNLHEAERYNAFVYPAQKYGGGFSIPIGSRDIIQSAGRDDLIDFYKTWYRPELATLVVVGDIDPKAVEAEIKARFGDWQAAAPAPEEPQWGTRSPRGVQMFEYTNTGITRRLHLEWIRPPETLHDTAERHIARTQEAGLILLLNRRLAVAAQAKDSAILRASAAQGTAFKTSRIVALDITPKPNQTKAAFDQAYAVLKTLRDQGVTDTEVKRIAAETAEARARDVKGFDSRTNKTIADIILGNIAGDIVVRDLKETLAGFDEVTPHLDKAGFDAAAKALFAGDGPVLSNYGPTTTDFDQTAFKAEYLAQEAAPDVPYVEAALTPWPYTDFGPAQAPASHTVDADFGYDHFVYPNGVVLNVKSTTFDAGSVEVGVDFLGGRQRFDPKTPRPLRLAIGAAFTSGGLGKLDYTAMTNALTGKRISEKLTVGDSAATLSGTTSADDLATELQVLMAYTVDPGLRGADFDRYKTAMASEMKSLRAAPTGMLALEFNSVIQPGDWRYDDRALDSVATTSWSDITPIFRELLSDTPIVITLVGDVDPQTAADAVARTFATLPKRPAKAPKFAGADETPFPPPPGEHVFYHDGRRDLSVSTLVWPTTGFYTDVRSSYRLSLLALVIRTRLFDSLREKLGADYSPTVHSQMDDDFPKLGYIRVDAQVKAGDDKVFRDTLTTIAADLRAHPISADELLRVKAPMLQAMDNDANSNPYWFSTVGWLGRQPEGRTAALNRKSYIESTTAADLQALAGKYLKDDTAVYIRVVPRDAPAKVDDGH